MITFLNDIMAFLATHEAVLAVGAAWASREWSQMWPSFKMAYPWLKSEGGVKGVISNVLVGEPQPVQPKPDPSWAQSTK